jgi:hypothetical protein
MVKEKYLPLQATIACYYLGICLMAILLPSLSDNLFRSCLHIILLLRHYYHLSLLHLDK